MEDREEPVVLLKLLVERGAEALREIGNAIKIKKKKRTKRKFYAF